MLLIFNFTKVANGCLVSQKTIFDGTTGSLQPEARSTGHSEKNAQGTVADSGKEIRLEMLQKTTRQLSLGDDVPQGMVPS